MENKETGQSDEAAKLWQTYVEGQKTRNKLPRALSFLAFFIGAVIVIVGVWIVIYK